MTSYNQDQSSWNTRYYTPEFYVGGSQGIRNSSLSKTTGNSSKQIIDNVLNFKNSNSTSSYSILLGQSTRIEKWETLTGSAQSVPGFDEQSKYLVNGSFRDRFSYDAAARYNGISFFTRGTYNYNDKYLATITFKSRCKFKISRKMGLFSFYWVWMEYY